MSDPKIPQKQPYVMQIEPGNYAWCSCGHSDNQPYCDGSHKSTDFNPIVHRCEESQTVAWCGCKHSANAPFCDGTHANL